MIKHMAKVTIDEKRCKGCALCASVCPKKIIALSAHRLNEKGHHPAEIVNQELCIACAMCARMCPDAAIMVER